MGNFAAHWGPEALLTTGNALRTSTAYTVMNSGTNTPATLFTNRTKGVSQANPGLVTTAAGNAEFFPGTAGFYDIWIGGALVLSNLMAYPDPADFVTLDANAKVPKIQLPGFASQTVVIGPGDSITSNAWSMAGPASIQSTASSAFSSSAGYFTWAQMRLRDRFRVLGTLATGGWGLHDWLTTRSADLDTLFGLGPNWAIVLIGTNDLGLQARTATALITDFQALFARAAAAGVNLIVGTILPRGGANALSGTAEGYRLVVNNWLKSAPFSYPGVICVDWATPLTTGAAGAATSALFLDGLHPNTAGQQVMGRVLADALTGVTAPVEHLLDNNADTSNVISNGLMVGDNGSGLATPGWSIATGSPTPTYATSKVARTDGPGEWQRIVITVEGALIVQHSITAATTLVPGERYVAEFEFRNASFTSITDFHLYMLMLTPGYTAQANLPLWGPMTPGELPASGVLRTPWIYATTASTSVYFWVYLAGLGSIEMSRCCIRSIGP